MCSRCERAGRNCTGYKNAFDINLRNETHSVARRVRSREAYSHRLRNLPSVPYEQQAVSLFLENFVLDPSGPTHSRGFLGALLPLLRTANSNSLLSSTVDAVGLCFLAMNMVNKSIASRAARSYLRSLNRLQTTLYHDVDGISTETMMSVYLMGLYEVSAPKWGVELGSRSLWTEPQNLDDDASGEDCPPLVSSSPGSHCNFKGT